MRDVEGAEAHPEDYGQKVRKLHSLLWYFKRGTKAESFPAVQVFAIFFFLLPKHKYLKRMG
jgi:hypothetical protein